MDEINWAEVERMYTDGVMSLRQIARDYGVSEAAIRKRAAKYGWVRAQVNLIRQLAHEKADQYEPRTFENAVEQRALPAAGTDERIESLASLGAAVITSHRKDIGKTRDLVRALVQELTEATDNIHVVEEAIEAYFLAKAEFNPLAAAAYKQQVQFALGAISLGSRSKTAMNLANALGRLVELERKSYRLDEEKGEKSYEEHLAELHAKALQGRQDPSLSNAA